MRATSSRWWYAAGAALAVTAVTVGATVAANAGLRPGSGGAAPAAAPAASAVPRSGGALSAAPSAAAPSAAAPSAAARSGAPSGSEDRRPLGEVVDTGFGDRVLYAVSVDEPVLPETTFGVMLGRRLPDGTLTADVMANEVEGSDRAPGFHAGSAAMTVDGRRTLTFGYYAGPATRITARSGGRTVTAKLAVWSEDPSITFFWFGPRQGEVSHPRAYDRDGRALATGNAGFGVG